MENIGVKYILEGEDEIKIETKNKKKIYYNEK
jgi:hypothetical protein